MRRREFVKNSAILTAGSMLALEACVEGTHSSTSFGIQLWTLPRSLEDDFEGTLGKLASMGYKEVEFYGPYSFSAVSAKERWKMLNSLLKFSGSGFFGRSAEEVKQTLERHGLTSPSMHTDFDTLRKGMEALGEVGNTVGYTYVILPAIPGELRTSLDDYRRLADVFNSIGEEAVGQQLRFAYHNHGYGLREVDGEIPMQILMERTDPDYVFFQMDTFWTVAGGADPLEYLNAYPNRFPLMHIKDMKPRVTFDGDGGDPEQWTKLFPHEVPAGKGDLPIPEIIETGKRKGTEHFLLEMDLPSQAEDAAKVSIDYLRSV